jgi:sideroflexin-5
MSTSTTELFTIEEPLFDTNTYLGRFEEFRAVANPLHAFYTNSRIRQMQKLIENQKQAEQAQFEKTGDRRIPLTREQIRDLRIAETVISTAIHPDTKQMLPWTQRFSSFLPMNIPICFGFIIAAPTPFNTIFWQWVNQTYNAWLNYGNRNASSNYTMEDISKSYVAACASSITIGLGIRKMLAKRSAAATGASLILLNSVSSFFACASAGFLNAYFMRQTEMQKGISVLHPDTDEELGKSQACAYQAVMKTAISRIFLNVTIFVPPLFLVAIEKARLMPQNWYLKTLVEAVCITGELYLAVPVGIAMFPQKGSINAEDLEPEFQNIKDANGQMIRVFNYNKGL